MNDSLVPKAPFGTRKVLSKKNSKKKWKENISGFKLNKLILYVLFVSLYYKHEKIVFLNIFFPFP